MTELLRPDDARDALRKIGGLLLGIGILMMLLRKSTLPQESPYKDGVVFLLLAVPAIVLFGGSLTQRQTDGLRSWQTVYGVFGLIFVALALLQLVSTLDEDYDGAFTYFWIFAVVAGLGFYSGISRGLRFQLLFGSIAVIISWSALWDKILGDEGLRGNLGVYRGLLGILAVGLLAGALYLWRTNPGGEKVAETPTRPGGDLGLWKASELLTGAGIAAVLGCSLGITAIAGLANPFGTPPVQPVDTSWAWDVLLLLVSLGLVGLGSLIGVRGPVYVGAIGLFLFLLIAGLDLDSDPPQPTKLGTWPIVLLVLGGLAILLSGVKEAGLGRKPRTIIDKLREGEHRS